MGPFLTNPIYIFINTFVFPKDYIRPRTYPRNIVHFNNILYSLNGKTSVISEMNQHKSNQFDNDWINFAIPKFVKDKKLWVNLFQVLIPFKNLSGNDLTLNGKIAKAFKPKAIEIRGFEKVEAEDLHSVGAYQNARIISPLKSKKHSLRFF